MCWALPRSGRFQCSPEITQANATWTDISNDWKNGTANVKIDARAIIVGLRDVYHPKYPAAESRVPDQYRADILLKEFEGCFDPT